MVGRPMGKCQSCHLTRWYLGAPLNLPVSKLWASWEVPLLVATGEPVGNKTSAGSLESSWDYLTVEQGPDKQLAGGKEGLTSMLLTRVMLLPTQVASAHGQGFPTSTDEGPAPPGACGWLPGVGGGPAVCTIGNCAREKFWAGIP